MFTSESEHSQIMIRLVLTSNIWRWQIKFALTQVTGSLRTPYAQMISNRSNASMSFFVNRWNKLDMVEIFKQYDWKYPRLILLIDHAFITRMISLNCEGQIIPVLYSYFSQNQFHTTRKGAYKFDFEWLPHPSTERHRYPLLRIPHYFTLNIIDWTMWWTILKWQLLAIFIENISKYIKS